MFGYRNTENPGRPMTSRDKSPGPGFLLECSSGTLVYYIRKIKGGEGRTHRKDSKHENENRVQKGERNRTEPASLESFILTGPRAGCIPSKEPLLQPACRGGAWQPRFAKDKCCSADREQGHCREASQEHGAVQRGREDKGRNAEWVTH